MRSLFRVTGPLLLLMSCLVSGCASTMQFTPEPVPAQYRLKGLPSNAVQVEIKDMRADGSGKDGLADILRKQISDALPQDSSQTPSGHHTLEIDIIEHRSYFTLGNWNASTKFRARLVDASGNTKGQWEAVGAAHRANLWGYADAKKASQEAYNVAVADLMSSLSSVTLAN